MVHNKRKMEKKQKAVQYINCNVIKIMCYLNLISHDRHVNIHNCTDVQSLSYCSVFVFNYTHVKHQIYTQYFCISNISSFYKPSLNNRNVFVGCCWSSPHQEVAGGCPFFVFTHHEDCQRCKVRAETFLIFQMLSELLLWLGEGPDVEGDLTWEYQPALLSWARLINSNISECFETFL